MQRKDRFGALIAIDSSRHQSIEAAAVADVGQRHAGIIITKEPGEGVVSRAAPFVLTGCLISRHGCVDRGRRFDRLLVECQGGCIGAAESMLGQFGCRVSVDDTPQGWAVSLGKSRSLAGCEIRIAADPSSAAFPLIAAAIMPGSDVSVRGMLVNPLRTGLIEVLEQMGGDIEVSGERIQSGEIVADVQVRNSSLRPCQVTAEQIPSMIDEIPALAVACAFADGESVIDGLGELRVKESDRLGAIVAGLAACRRPTNSGGPDRTGNNWKAMIRDADGYSQWLVIE